MRELEDGRVLVTDHGRYGPTSRLVVVDFVSGSITEIGQTGIQTPGVPGEFLTTGMIYPLGNDSSIVTDWFTRGWTVLHDTDPVRIVNDGGRISSLAGPRIGGISPSRQVLALKSHPEASIEFNTDTLALLLVDMDSRQVDTIAWLRGPGSDGVAHDAGSVMTSPVTTQDAAVMFGDGWIAVARVDPYRVEWRSPEGEWTSGSPLPHASVEMEQSERCFALERTYEAFYPAHFDDCDLQEMFSWPSKVPPFTFGWHYPGNLLAAPDGRLFVLRAATVEKPETTYDIIDRRSRLQAHLVLPAGAHIIGFGEQHVYTVVAVSPGHQILRQHRWP